MTRAGQEGKSLATLTLTKKQENLVSAEGSGTKLAQEKKISAGGAETNDDDWGELGKAKGKKKEKKGKAKTKGKTGGGQTSSMLLEMPSVHAPRVMGAICEDCVCAQWK